MSFSRNRMRRSVPGVVALTMVLILFLLARLPGASGAERQQIAGRYKFTEMAIAMPPGYHPFQTVRKVNPAYYHIRSWISAVGASIAVNDLWGRGRADVMCLVDTRTNEVVVTYAPTAPAQDRFTPFALNAAPLPMDSAMAPMGCTPGDFNGDGRMDLMVNYWGRTPILFLAKSNATTLSNAAYQPAELVPNESPDGLYHGPRWNTNAVNVGDFDGTGHPDILVANYFPDSDVLNPAGQDNVTMNSSMSNAKNGGGMHVMRWYGGSSGAHPTAQYVEEPGAVPYSAATGWTLAMSSADLTGDGLPDVYVANDFGKDHLLYNVSTPGQIKFTEAIGKRTPTTPKSFVLGHGSFKGMGVDFGDLNDNGKFDMVVSNITTAWGLEESNFAWINTARNNADMQRQLADGVAPFTQQAQQLGLAWTGWGWDVKMGDFRNDGNLEVLQAEGFIKGKINRWPWLQEMAMSNDQLYTNPTMWPNAQPGDDIAGSQPMAFYSRPGSSPTGAYVNISKQLGLAVPIPTRGIATADTRGTGALDFAVARQWGPPAFYANNTPGRGNYLGLSLYRPVAGATPGHGLQGTGSPAYGAVVQIRTPDGHTQISQLDGGGGHSGKRSFEVSFGLGTYNGPVGVRIQWSQAGLLHRQTLQLTPGNHTLLLDSAAKEVPTR
jgi:enediyne biosynthesis protein E4